MIDAENFSLIDEFERLKMQKDEIVEKLEEVRKKIINSANEKGVDVLFGTNKKCLVKGYEKVVYPEDMRTFVQVIKNKGLYDKVSCLNRGKFMTAVKNNELCFEVLDMIKLEKDFRVSLKER